MHLQLVAPNEKLSHLDTDLTPFNVDQEVGRFKFLDACRRYSLKFKKSVQQESFVLLLSRIHQALPRSLIDHSGAAGLAIFATSGRFISFPESSRTYAFCFSMAILTLPLRVTFSGAFGA